MENAKKINAEEVSILLGKIFSFNNSLKLHHWSITGVGSYAKHIALDQALEPLVDILDRLVETTIAMESRINISIPETKNPSDIVKHIEDFAAYVHSSRDLFTHIFSEAIIDSYQETLWQLLYRLKRLQ